MMNNYEKSILLKDLSGRISFGVRCIIFNPSLPVELGGVREDGKIYFKELDKGDDDGIYDIDHVKPMLFRLSCMSERERRRLYEIFGLNSPNLEGDLDLDRGWNKFNTEIENNKLFIPGPVCGVDLMKGINQLYKGHYDFRGILDLGLGIEVSDRNNPYM